MRRFFLVFSINIFKEIMNDMPDLPSEEEYALLHDAHMRRIAAEAERERERELRRVGCKRRSRLQSYFCRRRRLDANSAASTYALRVGERRRQRRAHRPLAAQAERLVQRPPQRRQLDAGAARVSAGAQSVHRRGRERA